MSRTERIDELDAFRAVACLAIIVLHAYQDSRITTHYAYEAHPVVDTVLRNLDVGLAMFFVLSGFLIFRPFARAALQGDRCPSIRGYLKRRAWRLLPLYILVIVVVWSLRYAGTADNWRDLVMHLTFTNVYSNDFIFSTNGPAWSLAVEWHFYLLVALLAPAICRWAARLREPAARLAVVAAPVFVLIAASVAFKWWAQDIAGYSHERDYAIYYSALARLDTFAIGMLVAVAMVAWGERRRPGVMLPAALGVAGCLVLGVVFATRLGDATVNNLFYPLAGVACAALLVGTMLAPRDVWWRRLLRSRGLLWAGAGSYGAYLLHEPLLWQLEQAHVLTFKVPSVWPLATLALAALSLAGGWYAYRLVELPGMRIGALLGRREPPSPALAVQPWRAATAEVGDAVLPAADGSRVSPRALAGHAGTLVHLTPAPPDRVRLAHLDVARADRLLGDVSDWTYVAQALGLGVCAVTTSGAERARAAALRRDVRFPVLLDEDGRLGELGGGEWTTEAGERLLQPVTLLVAPDGRVSARITGVERHMERVLEQVRQRRCTSSTILPSARRSARSSNARRPSSKG